MNMKLTLLAAVVSVVFTGVPAFAKDMTHKWGVGIDAGATIPVSPALFRDSADPAFTLGGHVRYHLDSMWGLAASYDRLEFADTQLAANALTIGAFARLCRENDWTPWLGLGIGYDQVASYAGAGNNYWRFGVKGEAGVEYDALDSISFGAKFVYYYVAKNQNSLHVLAPTVSATWHFDTKH